VAQWYEISFIGVMITAILFFMLKFLYDITETN